MDYKYDGAKKVEPGPLKTVLIKRALAVVNRVMTYAVMDGKISEFTVTFNDNQRRLQVTIGWDRGSKKTATYYYAMLEGLNQKTISLEDLLLVDLSQLLPG